MIRPSSSVRAWPAPGKLNRFLHVVGRRGDGYHRLQTVFQFVDLCDSLDFAVRGDGEVNRLTSILGIAPEADLVVKAARALQRTAGCRLGVDVRIQKRLPIGGGLGGGSSDAATTLVALNRLWATQLSEDELCALGRSLGADVPVFVRGHAAWAEGIGDELTPVDLGTPWFLVAVPDTQVATARVFSAPELTRDTPEITIRDFLAGAGANDCEPVVYGRYPAVAAAARALERFGAPRLTGTGGCVFVEISEEASARRALTQLREVGIDGFVARGLNRSPLLDYLIAREHPGKVDTNGA